MIMNPVVPIAKVTFKEGVRNKVFYNILLFGLLIICSSIVLNKMTVGDQTKIIKDLGLTAMGIFGLLTILFLATNQIYREFEEKVIYTILVKPLSRREYLLGKYLGILLILAAEISAMFVLMMLLLLMAEGTVYWVLLKGVYTIFLELALISAVALLLATFMRPQLSILTLLAVYAIGHSTTEVRTIMIEKGAGAITRLVEAVYYLFPNFDNFDIKVQVVHNLQLTPYHLTLATIYALLYITLVLLLSMQLFARKEF